MDTLLHSVLSVGAMISGNVSVRTYTYPITLPNMIWSTLECTSRAFAVMTSEFPPHLNRDILLGEIYQDSCMHSLLKLNQKYEQVFFTKKYGKVKDWFVSCFMTLGGDMCPENT